ncbi:MAG: oligosaccharide flippase family protein [Bacteroidales bacterium]|nr:oligosaccharide flippase family protein [Bacteroidales bacterium]
MSSEEIQETGKETAINGNTPTTDSNSTSSDIKKLGKQTIIYGGSTILSRLLNYLLVPLHTYIFSDASQYGVVGELYAWTSLFMVILTYGMETAFFYFSRDKEIQNKVYSTIVTSLVCTSTLFIIICTCCSGTISSWIQYPDHPEYIVWFSIIIGVDAITSIFFARLRNLERPWRFVFVKITNILVNILCNLFFLLLCPYLLKNNPDSFIATIYNPSIGVGYIFISNLIASIVTLALLLPSFFKVRYEFDFALWKKMFRYALPMLVFGLAGIVNETMDRVLLKNFSVTENPQASVGIYSACYKISILMTIFVQAFKYSAEPFFFKKSKENNPQKAYAEIMTAFVFVCSIIYVGIMLYMDIIQYFVGPEYRVGLPIVPILLMANLFLGIFYNLSIWYKLTAQTKFGAYIAIFGAIITLVLNIVLIPRIDYMGSAWATFFCYLSMMIVSYFWGQKHYYVNYEVKKVIFYIALAAGVYGISVLLTRGLHIETLWARLCVNTMLLLVYISTLFMVNKKRIMQIIRRENR